VNGIHDLGGMHGFGPIEREEHEPVFHAQWERRIFAIAVATMGLRYYNTDELRRSIERIPPARYLASSYYERWVYAIEAMLVEKNLLSSEEIGARTERLLHSEHLSLSEARTSEAPPAPRTEPSIIASSRPRGRSTGPRPEAGRSARFKPGDRIITRNLNPQGHTRLPRYVRGRQGLIRRDWGVFVFPDTHAHGLGANPQHCYAVEFAARELWGDTRSATERIYVDLWEDYLSPAPEMGRKPQRRARSRSAAPTAKLRATPKSQGTRR
jgi:nitrile hydratase subunit beta